LAKIPSLPKGRRKVSEFKQKAWRNTGKNTSSTPSVVFTAHVNVTPPTATKPVATINALAASKAVDWFT